MCVFTDADTSDKLLQHGGIRKNTTKSCINKNPASACTTRGRGGTITRDVIAWGQIFFFLFKENKIVLKYYISSLTTVNLFASVLFKNKINNVTKFHINFAMITRGIQGGPALSHQDWRFRSDCKEISLLYQMFSPERC